MPFAQIITMAENCSITAVGGYMKFTVESEQNGAICVAVSGKVTQRNVSPLVEPLGEALGPGGYSRPVLLDMREVELLDSSGISWLLTCHKRFRNAGGKLILHSLSPIASNVIRVLNMQSVFCVASSREEALKQFQGESG